jgi:hypothetical protein
MHGVRGRRLTNVRDQNPVRRRQLRPRADDSPQSDDLKVKAIICGQPRHTSLIGGCSGAIVICCKFRMSKAMRLESHSSPHGQLSCMGPDACNWDLLEAFICAKTSGACGSRSKKKASLQIEGWDFCLSFVGPNLHPSMHVVLEYAKKEEGGPSRGAKRCFSSGTRGRSTSA